MGYIAFTIKCRNNFVEYVMKKQTRIYIFLNLMLLIAFTAVQASECLAPASRVEYQIKNFNDFEYLMPGFPDLFKMWNEEFIDSTSSRFSKTPMHMGKILFASKNMRAFFSNSENMNEGLVPFIILCLTPQIWYDYITTEEIFNFEKSSAVYTSPEIYKLYRLIRTIKDVKSYKDFFLHVNQLEDKYPVSKRETFNGQIDPMNITSLVDDSDKRLQDPDSKITHLSHIYSTLRSVAMSSKKILDRFEKKLISLQVSLEKNTSQMEELKFLGEDKNSNLREEVFDLRIELDQLQAQIGKTKIRYYKNFLPILLLKRLIIRHFFRPNLLSLRDYLPDKYHPHKRHYYPSSEMIRLHNWGIVLYRFSNMINKISKHKRAIIPFELVKNLMRTLLSGTEKIIKKVFLIQSEDTFISGFINDLQIIMLMSPDFFSVDMVKFFRIYNWLALSMQKNIELNDKNEKVRVDERRKETIEHIINLCIKLRLPIEQGLEVLEAFESVLGPIVKERKYRYQMLEKTGFAPDLTKLKGWMSPLINNAGSNRIGMQLVAVSS